MSAGGDGRPGGLATTGEAETQDARVAGALARAAVYRLLGLALAYPTPARMAEIPRVAGAAASVAPSPELASRLLAVGTLARAADAPLLAAEHVFLFDRQAPCPPYEGAWGDVPRLAGKPALLADVAGFYAAFGLLPSTTQADLEDHVVAELEFMSALATKEAWALAEDNAEWLEVTRAAEVRFLTDHLGRWAQAFTETLRSASPVPYYAQVADLLSTWIAGEADTLGASPERVEGPLGHDPLHEDTFTCPMTTPGDGGETPGEAAG
jgi:TorA maturation chaperone TorD